jgi:glycosyltransferase involved in cell wall biosynthesis
MPGLWRAARAAVKADIVYASAYPSLMYLGAVAASRSGARLILMPCLHPGLEGRSRQQRYFLSRRLIRLYRQAEVIIALTESERRLLVDAGLPPGRIHVSGAGIAPGDAAGADGDRFRRTYALADDEPVVTFIGHKTEGKGALDLLNACQILLAERPELTFALVGAPTPDFNRQYQTLSPRVRGRLLNLELSDAEKHDLLATSTMLVLPSCDDSFGIVLLEAWLHGKPVIGARAGGLPDVIDEQETGLLVPYGDVGSLAQAIGWLLDHPQQAAQMGSQGRQRTMAQWTWDAVYQRVRNTFEGEPGA